MSLAAWAEDQYETHLSEIQLVQIFLVVVIFLGSIATFLIVAGVKGYDLTVAWVRANLTVLMFLYVMPLSLIPVYSQLDDRIVKGVKQFTFAGVVIGFASFLLSIHSFWVLDPTPFQEAVFWLSKKLFGVTVFALMTSTILKQRSG